MSDKRRMRAAARLYAVQALFQMEAAGQSVDRVRKEFETHRFGARLDDDEMEEGDPDLFRALVEGAVDRQARIDQMTDRALVAKWPIQRIDPTLRALFRAAGSELTAGRMAVLISHRFSTVRMADRILVLGDGTVLEHGSHEELLAAEGTYSELFSLQAAGYR